MKKGVTTVAFEDEESKQLVHHGEVSAALWPCDVKIAFLMLTYLDEQQKIGWLESHSFDSFAF